MNKRKNGFTLIELLAVIVILAIIALIATPIVLNIIDDAKKESDLRSAEFYLKSLELGIAQATLKGTNIKDKVYNILKNGNVCLEKYEGEICKDEDGNPNNNELVVEVKGKKATLGTIVIENGQIVEKLSTDESKKTEFEINEQKIIMDGGELKYFGSTQTKEKTLANVCTYKSGTEGEISSKYECKVDPNKDPYTFYVLSYLDKDGNIVTDKSNAVSVNLIMDSNIRTGGEPVKEPNPTSEQKGLVAWNSSGIKKDGPITAMNYLQEATKNWTNTNEMKISKFMYENGKEEEMSKTYNTYARMPYKSEITTAIYLYEYLYGSQDGGSWFGGETKPSNIVVDVMGYWLLTSSSDDSVDFSYYVIGHGVISLDSATYSNLYGVRPVINLKI